MLAHALGARHDCRAPSVGLVLMLGGAVVLLPFPLVQGRPFSEDGVAATPAWRIR